MSKRWASQEQAQGNESLREDMSKSAQRMGQHHARSAISQTHYPLKEEGILRFPVSKVGSTITPLERLHESTR